MKDPATLAGYVASYTTFIICLKGAGTNDSVYGKKLNDSVFTKAKLPMKLYKSVGNDQQNFLQFQNKKKELERKGKPCKTTVTNLFAHVYKSATKKEPHKVAQQVQQFAFIAAGSHSGIEGQQLLGVVLCTEPHQSLRRSF